MSEATTGRGELGVVEEIGPEQFAATWREQDATSISESPCDPSYARYRIRVGHFLAGRVYAAFAVDESGCALSHLGTPGARLASFAELLASRRLSTILRRERRRRRRGRRRARPHVIVERCTACDTKVVKDGCKELAALGAADPEAVLDVTEIRGACWTPSRFDMRAACLCLRVRATV